MTKKPTAWSRVLKLKHSLKNSWLDWWLPFKYTLQSLRQQLCNGVERLRSALERAYRKVSQKASSFMVRMGIRNSKNG